MLAITPPAVPAPDGLKEVREGPKEFQEVLKEAQEAWSTQDTACRQDTQVRVGLKEFQEFPKEAWSTLDIECRPVTQVNKAALEVHSLQTLPWLNKLFHRL